MKLLHRRDLFGWSQFDQARQIDFHSLLWVRDGGNVVVDPLPMSEHDRGHLRELGGVATIVVTNSDHVRDAAGLAERTGGSLCGPAAEKDGFPLACDRWLGDGDEIVPGLNAVAIEGSKTPGELALLLEHTTLITGDFVRAHQGGSLCLLPEPKLSDTALAQRSLQRLIAITTIDAVIVGDGWPVFRDGHRALAAIAAR